MRIRLTIICTIICSCLVSFSVPFSVSARDEAIRRIATNQKLVALTFDDGPSATFTPQILDVLHEYHAKATFFVIGARVRQYANLLVQERDEDNEIENHTYSHQVIYGLPSERIQSDLSKAEDDILRTVGYRTHFFRPPRGRVDAIGYEAAMRQGYKVVLWSVDSRDWQNPGVAQIVKNVVQNVRPGDIILFHDQGGDRTQTVRAVRQVIEILRKRQYEFVTVNELLNAAICD